MLSALPQKFCIVVSLFADCFNDCSINSGIFVHEFSLRIDEHNLCARYSIEQKVASAAKTIGCLLSVTGLHDIYCVCM